MRDRSPYDGRPFYCNACGLGWGEYLACEEFGCAIETKAEAQERAAAQVGRNAKRQDAQRLGPKDEHAVPKGCAHPQLPFRSQHMTNEAEKAREMEPCPFCGKPARACPDTSYGYATVFCPDENECPVAPSADAEHTEGGLAEAINRWNIRAEKSRLIRGEVIEALTYYAEDVNAALCDDRDDEGYGRRARAVLASLKQESGRG